MVAVAEVAADLGQRHLGEVLGQRHGDLARPGYVARERFLECMSEIFSLKYSATVF